MFAHSTAMESNEARNCLLESGSWLLDCHHHPQKSEYDIPGKCVYQCFPYLENMSYDIDFCLYVCLFLLPSLNPLQAIRDCFIPNSSRFYCFYDITCIMELQSKQWFPGDVAKFCKSHLKVWYFDFQTICKSKVILVLKYG